MRAFPPVLARRGFTMIEVMAAVIILVITTLGVYKFVESNIRAIGMSQRNSLKKIALEHFFNYVQEQLYDLPSRGQATLLGQELKLNNAWLDTMEWRSRGGLGLLTKAATGEYQVKLTIKPVTKTSSDYEIGLSRRPALVEENGKLRDVGALNDKDASWVPMLQNVTGMKFRYFDARVDQWLKEWKDQDARPTLVEVSVWSVGEDIPATAVLTVPAAQTQK